MTRALTPDIIRAYCEALYGESGWQSALARDLLVTDRTVRRWVAGTTPWPKTLVEDLLLLTRRRIAILNNISQKLSDIFETCEQ